MKQKGPFWIQNLNSMDQVSKEKCLMYRRRPGVWKNDSGIIVPTIVELLYDMLGIIKARINILKADPQHYGMPLFWKWKVNLKNLLSNQYKYAKNVFLFSFTMGSDEDKNVETY